MRCWIVYGRGSLVGPPNRFAYFIVAADRAEAMVKAVLIAGPGSRATDAHELHPLAVHGGRR